MARPVSGLLGFCLVGLSSAFQVVLGWEQMESERRGIILALGQSCDAFFLFVCFDFLGLGLKRGYGGEEGMSWAVMSVRDGVSGSDGCKSRQIQHHEFLHPSTRQIPTAHSMGTHLATASSVVHV